MPIIAIIVYTIVELIKIPFKNKTKLLSIIPLIAGAVGGILGIVAFYVAPTIMPAPTVFHAILNGILSGLSATGSHQIVAQIKKINRDESSNIL
ncbi:MAG: phage holin family protein [Clostridia bacterium]